MAFIRTAASTCCRASVVTLTLLAATTLAAPAQSTPAPSVWPMTLTVSGGTVVVFQPQVRTWPGYRTLTGVEAVAVTPKGSATKSYGAVYFTAQTTVDYTTREVEITGGSITSTEWPNVPASQTAPLNGLVHQTIQFKQRTVPLDSVLASLSATTAKPRNAALKTDPPKIFYSQTNAILVVYDGDPIFSPIANTELKFAVNTNWDILLDNASSRYYLLENGSWLTAPGPNGPWTAAPALPASFGQLPSDDNWTTVRNALNAPPLAADAVPTVFVSTQPAELILTTGAPALTSIRNTHLQYVSNTLGDVFFDTANKTWYVLYSGRWFSGSSLQGPWQFAGTSLPADFARIPSNSPKASVLVSVPNTAASQYVSAASNVPQLATVDVASTTLTVSYSGDPQFQPISGTTLQYAVNTPYDVVKDGDQYYACYDGVWFNSGSATGPWKVARTIPSAIYSIPPSSPLYHDTFVYAYPQGYEGGPVPTPSPTAKPNSEAATDALLVGFTAGYLFAYPWNYGWYYGTGWYWPPYYYAGVAGVPVYYPYARTYAAGSYYNPVTGTTARGAAIYGPYGGAAGVAAYNPSTGTYYRGGAVWGPNGSVTRGSFYNPRTGYAGATRQVSTPYSQWGHSVVAHNNALAYAGHYSGANGQAAGIKTANGSAAVGKSANGDVYVGKDGNVYRNQDGTWQKNTGGNSWSSAPTAQTRTAQRPATTQDLNRDYSARQAGNFDRGNFGGGFGGARGGFGGRR